MFDLRYHVASLAAVFVALLIGILVGVAMSGKVDDAEKQSLQSDINRLEAELDAAGERSASTTREQKAFGAFVRKAYPSLIADRLVGKRIAIVFVGPVDAGVRRDIQRAIEDAGSTNPLRIRAFKVPIDPSRIDGELDGDLSQYRTDFDELGGELARELVDGGDAPAWDALTRSSSRRSPGASGARPTASSSRAPYGPSRATRQSSSRASIRLSRTSTSRQSASSRPG